MLNVPKTTKQEDESVKVSFNGTSRNGTHISGHYFLTKEEYEQLSVHLMKQKAYDILVEELQEEGVLDIKKTGLQADKKVKISFEANTQESTYLIGHYFLDKDEFEEMNIKQLKEKSYENIVNDFSKEEEEEY